MSQKTLVHGSGADWALGVAGANRWPTSLRNGDSTATVGSSVNATAKIVLVTGVWVSVAAAGTITIVDDAAAAIPGLTITLTASSQVGWYPFGEDGARVYPAATSGYANPGIACPAGVTANMYYARLA